jgi:hypothetical protein
MVNHTCEVVLRAVPRQSLRERSKWESAPGPSGAALVEEAAKDARCDAIVKTIEKRRASRIKNIGIVVRHRMRDKAGIDILCFSLKLIEALKNLVDG